MMQVSADHARLAYAVDLTGEEQYELYSKETGSGTVTQVTKLGDSSGSMAWALDNNTLFYVTLVRLCRCMLLADDCENTQAHYTSWKHLWTSSWHRYSCHAYIAVAYQQDTFSHSYPLPAILPTKDVCRVVQTAYTAHP